MKKNHLNHINHKVGFGSASNDSTHFLPQYSDLVEKLKSFLSHVLNFKNNTDESQLMYKARSSLGEMRSFLDITHRYASPSQQGDVTRLGQELSQGMQAMIKEKTNNCASSVDEETNEIAILARKVLQSVQSQEVKEEEPRKSSARSISSPGKVTRRPKSTNMRPSDLINSHHEHIPITTSSGPPITQGLGDIANGVAISLNEMASHIPKKTNSISVNEPIERKWHSHSLALTNTRKLQKNCLDNLLELFNLGKEQTITEEWQLQWNSTLKNVLDSFKILFAEYSTPQHEEPIKTIKDQLKITLVTLRQPQNQIEFNAHKQKLLRSIQNLSQNPMSQADTIINEAEEFDVSKSYTFLTTVMPVSANLMPIIKQTQSQWAIEEEKKLFNRNSYILNIKLDVYTRDFFGEPHKKFIRNGKDSNYVIVVREQKRFDFYPALMIGKKGYEEFSLEDTGHSKVSAKMLRLLTQKFAGDNIYRIKDSNDTAKFDIQKIEVESPQTKTELKVGIIYAKNGQLNPLDMFANPSSDKFEKFLKDMKISPAEKGPVATWKHLQVTWYPSPYLNSEQHRRCVGNSTSLIFFKDEGEQFDTSEVAQLGMVPQIFIVVQPYGQDYRVGFFHSGNLRPFGPELAVNYLFHPTTLLDFILTKIHNGNVMFYYCSPMNRAFILKRVENIEAIIENNNNKKYDKN